MVKEKRSETEDNLKQHYAVQIIPIPNTQYDTDSYRLFIIG